MTDLPVRNRSLVVLSAAASRGGVRRSTCRQRGFTLLELLTVIAIVVVLAGLILGGMGYAQQKAASSRATGEIAALSNLLEAFKADFGDYPPSSLTIGKDTPIDAGAAVLSVYLFGSQVLVQPPSSSDQTEYNEAVSAIATIANWAKKNSWPESGLSTTVATNKPSIEGKSIPARYLIDPFGNPYGYSTNGDRNPTFDLWSTAGVTGGTLDTNEPRWVKNW